MRRKEARRWYRLRTERWGQVKHICLFFNHTFFVFLLSLDPRGFIAKFITLYTETGCGASMIKVTLASSPDHLLSFPRRCGSPDARRGLRRGRPLRHGRQSHHSPQPQPQRPPQTQQRHHEGSVPGCRQTQASSVPHSRHRGARPATLPHQLRPEGGHYQ